MVRHVAEVDVDSDGWYWSCSCGEVSDGSYDDEGDALNGAEQHERVAAP